MRLQNSPQLISCTRLYESCLHYVAFNSSGRHYINVIKQTLQFHEYLPTVSSCLRRIFSSLVGNFYTSVPFRDCMHLSLHAAQRSHYKQGANIILNYISCTTNHVNRRHILEAKKNANNNNTIKKI